MSKVLQKTKNLKIFSFPKPLTLFQIFNFFKFLAFQKRWHFFGTFSAFPNFQIFEIKNILFWWKKKIICPTRCLIGQSLRGAWSDWVVVDFAPGQNGTTSPVWKMILANDYVVLSDYLKFWPKREDGPKGDWKRDLNQSLVLPGQTSDHQNRSQPLGQLTGKSFRSLKIENISFI